MSARAYRSKIGRLPHAVRHEVCERMRDGATAAAICAFVNGHPEWPRVRAAFGGDDLNPQNVTDWRQGGYQDWLADQSRTDRLRDLAALSESMVVQSGGDPAAVGSRLLAGKLLEALEGADPAAQGDLVKAFATLRGAENDAARTVLQREKNELARQALALDRQRFQRQTAELYQRWYADERARTIVEDRSTDNAAKTEALGQLMFGDLWESTKA